MLRKRKEGIVLFLVVLSILLVIGSSVNAAKSVERKAYKVVDGRREAIEGFAAEGDSTPNGVNKIFLKDETYDIGVNKPIYSLSISGGVNLLSDDALIRVVLVDQKGEEYLVYETYPLIADSGDFDVEDICEETCALSGIKVTSLKIQIKDGSLRLDSIGYSNSKEKFGSKVKTQGIQKHRRELKSKQDQYKVDKIREEITKKGLRWTPKETPISELSYEEKKKLFTNPNDPDAPLPNLQGFEYYGGGIFELEPTTGAGSAITGAVTLGSDGLPTEWDWRDKHGENWITGIRDQSGCNSCWAHAGLGATEGVTNVYYNQHIDIDLSEQETVCNHPGSCTNGGWEYWPMDELKSGGLVTENCYPTTNTESCPGRCAEWESNLWKITDYSAIGADDYTLKYNLITKGPLTFGIHSWWHIMALVGYETDQSGNTVWILKETWGEDYGEGGYVRAIISQGDRGGTQNVVKPYFASNPDLYQINCVDNDNDGFCNWGLISEKPSTCPAECSSFPDCDDSDPILRQYDENFMCIACGDGECRDDETCGTCPDDCGACPEAECSDSDGGQNYNVKGETIGWDMDWQEVTASDVCTPTGLTEYYCSNDNYVESISNIFCPNGCIDGYCCEGNTCPHCGDGTCSPDWNESIENCPTDCKSMVFTEHRITDDPEWQQVPDIYEDYIVWGDDRDKEYVGDYEIVLYDINTKEWSYITDAPWSQRNPIIHGNIISWQDDRDGDFLSDIYYYDLTTGTEHLASAMPMIQSPRSIYDGKIAYRDGRNFGSCTAGDGSHLDVFIYDTANRQETRITTNDCPQRFPAIWKDKIVFQDDRNVINYIYGDLAMYDTSTEQLTFISSAPGQQAYPDIYENIIVWQDSRDGDWDIYMYDLETGIETQVTSDSADQIHPKVHGNIIVWRDNTEDPNKDDSTPVSINIWAYDISTKQIAQVTDSDANQYQPNVYGNRIVWTDRRNGNADVYMAEISWDVLVPPHPPHCGDDECNGEETYATCPEDCGNYGIEIIQVTDSSGTEKEPVINGERIAYSGTSDIFIHNLNTGEDMLITNAQNQQHQPAINGDMIVWRDSRNDYLPDIYSYDLSTGTETPVTLQGDYQWEPQVYGDKVVWHDDRNVQGLTRHTDIYMYDFSTGEETRLTTDVAHQSEASIYGDKVVFKDSRNVIAHIYMIDLATEEEAQLTTDPGGQLNPYIYQNKVVHEDFRNGEGDIYMYDISTGQETQITTDPARQYDPIIHERYVVWTDERNVEGGIQPYEKNTDIYAYDLIYGEEFQVTKNEFGQIEPWTFEDKIVWSDYRGGNSLADIYMATILTGDSIDSCGNGICDVGESFETCPGDCDEEDTGSHYYYYNLTDGNCSVNISLTADLGYFILYAHFQPDVTPDVYDVEVNVSEGETRSISNDYLDSGMYVIKVSGTGEYNLERESYCRDDSNDPKATIEGLPQFIDKNTLLNASVSDEGVGLDEGCDVCISLDGICDDEWTNATGVFNRGDKTGTCNYLWDVSSYDDGNYTIKFKVRDLVNNSGASDNVVTILDRFSPIIDIIYVTYPANANSMVDVVVNISDEGGIGSVWAMFEGQAASMNKNASGVYTTNIIAPGEPGNHVLTIGAEDFAGHNSSEEIIVRVNEKIDWSDDVKMGYEDGELSGVTVAKDGTGNKHIVLYDNKDGNYEIYYSKMAANGKVLVYNQRLTNNMYNSKNPSIDVDSSNNVHIVWVDDRDNNKEIYYSKIVSNGVGDVDDKRITYNLFESKQPKVKVVGNDVFLLWLDDKTGIDELYFRKLDNNGNTVIGDKKVTGGPDVVDYDVVINDGINVVWQDTENKLYYLKVDLDGEVLTQGDLQVVGTEPCIDVDNLIHIAFTDIENNIEYLQFDSNLELTKQSMITVTGLASNPAIEAEASIHIVYEDMLQRNKEAYYVKLDRDGEFLVENSRLTYSDPDSFEPAIVLGSVYVFWEENNTFYYKTTADLEGVAPIISSVFVSDSGEDYGKVTWTTDEISYSVVYYGTTIPPQQTKSSSSMTKNHEITINDLQPQTVYYFYVVSSDTIGNEGIDNNYGAYYTVSTTTQRYKPELPTILYGLVQYVNGTPAEGVTVTASWIDAGNESKTTEATTLTEEEAIAINDSSLTGYYLFNKGNIRAKVGTTITVKAPSQITDPDPYLTSDPGGNSHRVIGGPIILDTAPPVITIHHPQEDVYSVTDLYIEYNVDEDIQWAGFSLNGQDDVAITDMQNQRINITARMGYNTLTVSARDLLGLLGSKSVSFVVNDTVAPEVIVNSVGTVHGVVNLSANVSDATNDLKQSCEVCVSSDGVCDSEWTSSGVDNVFVIGDVIGMCYYEWDTAGLESGAYAINFRVKDVMDNLGTGEVVTAIVDNTAPNPITGLAVEKVLGQASLDISWDISNAQDFRAYRVYRSESSFSSVSPTLFIRQIEGVDGNSLRDMGLREGTTYYYAVTAVDYVGNENKNVFSVSGKTIDITAPIVTVTEPEPRAYAITDIPLEFSADEEVESCSYNLDTGINITVDSPTSINVGEGTHDIVVYCTDLEGNVGKSPKVTFSVDTLPPAPVQITGLTQVGSDVFVEWEQSDALDFKEYRIYRRESSFNDVSGFSPVYTISSQVSTNKLDEETEEDTTYYYAVTVLDTSSLENKQVTASPIYVRDETAPDPIANVQVNRVSGEPKLRISWSESTASDFASYNVYKADDYFDEISMASKIATINSKSTTSYEDSNVIEDLTYYYAVTGVDDSGNEEIYVESVPGDVGDLTGPNVMITLPSSNITYSNPVTLSFEVSEDPSACRYKLNEDNEVVIDPSEYSCQKILGGYDFYNEDTNPQDDHGHGTHVAATAAGQGTLNGIAPDAKILVYKVLGRTGSGYTSDVIAGIEQAVIDGADIMSLSLGGSGDPDGPSAVAIDNAFEAGVLPVVSAGNSGPGESTIGCPGCARKALTVGASSKSDSIASFSSRGPTSIMQAKPELSAPGVDICAAQWETAWEDKKCLDDEHTAISGTSMAAPHVSGAAALVMQAHPDWTIEEVGAALKETSVDIGYNINTQGSGRIDVLEAVNTNVIATPSTINLGLLDYSQSVWQKTERIKVKNVGNVQDTFSISISNNVPGITINVNPIIVTLSPGQTANVDFTIIVEKDVVNDGSYEGAVSIEGSQNTIRVPYYFEKSSVVEFEFSEQPYWVYIFGETSAGDDFNDWDIYPPREYANLIPKGNYDMIVSFNSKYFYMKGNLVVDDYSSIYVDKALITNKVSFKFKDKDGVDRTPYYYPGWFSTGHDSGYSIISSIGYDDTYFNNFDDSFFVSLISTIFVDGDIYDVKFGLENGVSGDVILESNYENYGVINYVFNGADAQDTMYTANGECIFTETATYQSSLCGFSKMGSEPSWFPWQRLESPFTRTGYISQYPYTNDYRTYRSITVGDSWPPTGETVKYDYNSGMLLYQNGVYTVTDVLMDPIRFVTRELPGNVHTIDVEPIEGALGGDLSLSVLDKSTGESKICSYDVNDQGEVVSGDVLCNQLLESYGAIGQVNGDEKQVILAMGPNSIEDSGVFDLIDSEEGMMGGGVGAMMKAQKEKSKKKHKIIVELKDNPEMMGGSPASIQNKQNSMINKMQGKGTTIKKKFSKSFNGIAVSATEDQILDILKDSDVKRVYKDEKVEAVLTDSPGIIGADSVWQQTDMSFKNITGKGITIAVIDTGIDHSHEDFSVCDVTPSIDMEGRDGENQVIVSCDDQAGNTGYSDPRMFTVDASAPVVENLSVVYDDEQSLVRLDWNKVVVDDFSEYNIYRSEQEFTNVEDVDLLDSIYDIDSTNYYDNVTGEGTVMYYAVTTVDNRGNEEKEVVSESVVVPDRTSPVIDIIQPENMTYDSRDLILQYSASEEVVNCRYYVNLGESVSFTLNPMPFRAREGDNTIKIRCDDLAGNMGESDIVGFKVDIRAPGAIGGLKVVDAGDSRSLNVSWNASGAQDIKEYKVYRSLSDFNDVSGMSAIRTTSNTIIIDSGLTVGQTYYYAVTAVDLVGNEDKNVVAVSSMVVDMISPNIVITSPINNELYNTQTISLTYSADEEVVGCSYSLNNGAIVDVTDNIEASEGSNTIRVYCTDLAGNQGQSELISFIVDSTAPGLIRGLSVESVPNEASLELSWDLAIEPDLEDYRIYRSLSDFNDVSGMSPISDVVVNTFKDVDLISDTTYYYAVTGVDLVGNENKNVFSVSGTVPDLNPPEQVTGLDVNTVQGQASLDLLWDESSADDFNNYNIYRSIGSFSDVSQESSGDELGEFLGVGAGMIGMRRAPAVAQLTEEVVLITGGFSASALFGTGNTRSTELFKLPSFLGEDVQSYVGPTMAVARDRHTATSLDDGRVLIFGGTSSFGSYPTGEVYNPPQDLDLDSLVYAGIGVGNFTQITGENCETNIGRLAHIAIKLDDGRVLIAGGFTDEGEDRGSAVIFDPSTNCYTHTGNLNQDRARHRAIKLNDGRILIVGDSSSTKGEIYNPNTGTFTYTGGNVVQRRDSPAAVLLSDGRVLIAGGNDPSINFLNNAEVYDPVTDSFSAVANTMSIAHTGAKAALLSDGKAIVFGGLSDYDTPIKNVEVYDPETNSFSRLPSDVKGPGDYFDSIQLDDGRVFKAGGANVGSASAEMFFSSGTGGELIQTIGDQAQTIYRDNNLVSESTYHYAVTAVDIDENEDQDVSSVAGTVADLNPPTISITSPVEGETYNSRTVDLNYNSNEDVRGCWYSLNDGELTLAPYTITADNGLNSVKLYCDDNSENRGESQLVNFIVDTLAPDPVSGLVVNSVARQEKLDVIWEASGALDLSSYNIYRSDSEFIDVSSMTPVASVTNTSYIDDSVLSEETYYYAVTAVDIYDNEDKLVISVNGKVDDLTPPDKTTGLEVIQIAGENALDLIWEFSLATDFANYKIYRSDNAFSDVSSMDSLIELGDTSYKDENLTSGATYYYAITAIDESGNEDKNVVAVKGTVADTIKPTVNIVSPITKTYNTNTIDLMYNVSEPTSLCQYSLNNHALVDVTQEIVAEEGSNTIKVYCDDLALNKGESTLVSFSVDTTAPPAISGLDVGSILRKSDLQISWNPSPASDLSHYYIYRSNSAFDDVTGMNPIKSVELSPYTDENLVSESTYYYAVTAVDEVGNENKEVVSVAGKVADTLAPIVTIDSPENKVYGERDVELSYSVNEETTWCMYSLNSGSNI